MPKILLCTDLDRTLIPNGEQRESPGVRDVFAKFVERDEVALAYVSGRNRPLIQKSIADFGLPVPDFTVANVGANIYNIEDGEWHHWQPWENEITGDWNDLSAADLRALLNGLQGLDGLRPQEPSKQSTHKVSYYLPMDADEAAVTVAVQERLEAEGVEARVIWSIDEPNETGLLDILPISASIRHAIEFLMRSNLCDADHTVFAGDSGNDLDVLLSPIRAVAVANADDDVRAALRENNPENTYVARGGFCGMNGNYAAGILEGVAHFFPQYIPIIAALADRHSVSGNAA